MMTHENHGSRPTGGSRPVLDLGRITPDTTFEFRDGRQGVEVRIDGRDWLATPHATEDDMRDVWSMAGPGMRGILAAIFGCEIRAAISEGLEGPAPPP